MSDKFSLEIINPEASFFIDEDVSEVVLPAIEGEMGILKDHIPIISFLKPGLIKVYSKDKEEIFYVDDGIVEFKENLLSILTSKIFNLREKDNSFIDQNIKDAEKLLEEENLTDQIRFLANQKIQVLKSLD
tara:strand:- start:681 stop:1073 length:393 start_codon:yes stop_codon:yes gene_type:complete